jgi:hypothetical protein
MTRNSRRPVRRLTESQLRRIIRQEVRRVRLTENFSSERIGQSVLALQANIEHIVIDGFESATNAWDGFLNDIKDDMVEELEINDVEAGEKLDALLKGRRLLSDIWLEDLEDEGASSENFKAALREKALQVATDASEYIGSRAPAHMSYPTGD